MPELSLKSELLPNKLPLTFQKKVEDEFIRQFHTVVILIRNADAALQLDVACSWPSNLFLQAVSFDSVHQYIKRTQADL
jgi:hypothetical protein